MATMKDSVFVMAKWLNLHMMQNQYLTAFKKMAESGNLSKGMKDEKWKELLDRAQEPNPDDPQETDVFMDAEEWEKLYKVFLKTFRAMKDDEEALKDAGNKDALKLLNLLYGPNNYFYPRQTDPQKAGVIKKLFEFFESPEGKDVGEYLLKQIGIEKTSDIADFIGKIKKGKYDSDAELKYKLESLLRDAKWFISDNNQFNAPSARVKNELKVIETEHLLEALDDKEEQIQPVKINDFKTIYPALMRTLITQEKSRNAFAAHGGNKVTDQINKALEKTNYKDENSADYVAPSEKDTLTWQQQLKKDWDDFKDDTILKLKNRAKYDKYLMPEVSKPIAIEIYNAGWKPEDGLAKLGEVKSKLEGKFKGKKPECAKALKFLMEALDYAKNKIPKAFDGALKNGKQGLALDILIAEYGLKNGKSDAEITAAHEVLSKLRWGYNTSVTREKLFKDSISLFGDKNLSWNKQGGEAMQTVTGAVDKTINFVFKQTFNIFNAGINAIRRHGRYYKLDNNEQKRIDAINAGIDGKITDLQTERTKIEANRNQRRNDRAPFMQTMRTLYRQGFDRNAYNQANTDIQTSNQMLEQLEQQKQTEKQTLNTLQDQADQLNAQIQNLQDQIQHMTSQRQNLQILEQMARQNGDLAAAAQAQAQIQQITANINQANNNVNAIQANQLQPVMRNITTVQRRINGLDQQINNETTRIQPTKDKVNQYDDAMDGLKQIKEDVDGLNNSLQIIDEDINKLEDKEKKRFLNLMATRNMMNGEGGFVKNRNPFSLFLGSQKKIQEDFNANKDAIKQQYIAQFWANQGVTIAA